MNVLNQSELDKVSGGRGGRCGSFVVWYTIADIAVDFGRGFWNGFRDGTSGR